jgi:hypothetical protein
MTVVCGIDCLACQDEFFINNPLDVKENDEHALDFALQLLRIFLVCPELSMQFKHSCTAHAFFPERLSNNCQGLRCTSSEICTKFYDVPLSDPSWNRVRPDMRLEIKGRKISTSTQLHEILYIDSQDVLVLSSIIASSYYNYCTESSISPGNYGYTSYTAAETLPPVIFIVLCRTREQFIITGSTSTNYDTVFPRYFSTLA